MSDFKVVYRADDTGETNRAPQWEPGCPVLVTAVQVSRHTITSNTYLQVRIDNLCDRAIETVCGSATLTYNDGSQETVEFERLDVDLAPRDSQALQAVVLPRPDAKSAQVVITHVAGDTMQWESSARPIDPPQSKPLNFGAKAAQERNRRLEEAGFSPEFLDGALEIHDGWWLCSCGRPNVNRTTCCGCGCEKQLLVELNDEAALDASIDAQRSQAYDQATALLTEEPSITTLSRACQLLEKAVPWEDSVALLETCTNQLDELKARRNGRVKKKALIIGGSIAVVAVVVLLLVFLVFPMLKYNDAMSKADASDFDGSIAALQELGSFNGADSMIPQIEERQRQARYDAAEEAMDNGDHETAIAKFEEIGDDQQAKNAKLEYARTHLDASDKATVRYLDELAEANYKDAKDLYLELANVRVDIKVIGAGDEVSAGNIESMPDLGTTFDWSDYSHQGITFAYKITTDTPNFNTDLLCARTTKDEGRVEGDQVVRYDTIDDSLVEEIEDRVEGDWYLKYVSVDDGVPSSLYATYRIGLTVAKADQSYTFATSTVGIDHPEFAGYELPN